MDRIEMTIQELYKNNQYKLRQMCNKEMARFGGISQKDYDDFYSRAGYEISRARKRYDSSKGKSFIEYISGVIKKAVWKEMTDKNRNKRQLIMEKEEKDVNGNILKIKEYVPTLSIDTPISNENDLVLSDTLQSDFNMDTALEERIGNFYNDNIEEYLKNLSDLQRMIVKQIMNGYSFSDIKKMYKLTDKQFQDSWNIICSYEKKRVLYKENGDLEEKNMNETVLIGNVVEKYKNTSYSIESMSKQLRRRRIRDDHVLQRYSGQWKNFEKSELISDILRGKSLGQVVICEEIKDGVRMQWLIDGKQRCTTLDDYLHDGFAISKNVGYYNIQYQANKLDENGKEVLNQEGFTVPEIREFDIRGKKFSQLPEELQDIFKDRQIPVLSNTNCTKKDIADDIARFNRSRPMNKAQNGWLGLDESFAEFVENIAKMPFFQPEFAGSAYTDNNRSSGKIRRIIVESIMISNFIDDFCDFDKICEHLSEEASDSNFTSFYEIIERLTAVCNEKVSKMFNVKDSFLWFGLFSKFVNLDIDDNKFVDFLIEFDNSLRNKKVSDITFEELCINPKTGKSRSTKDKNIVISKMELLEKLMLEFFHVEKFDNEVMDSYTFIKENVNSNITKEDVEQYEEVLDDLTVNIDNSSKLLDKRNRISLVALVAYSFENDIDLDKWIINFFNKNDKYIINQKENYLYMKTNLEQFIVDKDKKRCMERRRLTDE